MVECNICKLHYVGETCRFLKKRIYEHLTRKESAVYIHHSTTHNNIDIYDTYTFDTLHTNLNDLKKRLYIETMYITKYSRSLMNGCIRSVPNSLSFE